MQPTQVILGLGDIGKRLALSLVAHGAGPGGVIGTTRSGISAALDLEAGIDGLKIENKALNLDGSISDLSYCHDSSVYYLIPPQSESQTDQRSSQLLSAFSKHAIVPKKVVLLSTTGVYGDCAGEWVDETSPCKPNTDRARRRVSAEQQWMQWGEKTSVPLVVVRVPGIYANSRIRRKRLVSGTPVVRAQECGFTNRIHADDLVLVLLAAMRLGQDQQFYNATDGRPGKLSEFLQASAREIGVPPLIEISMDEANEQLSKEMQSYLRESRRISNEKMLSQLKVDLRYPNFENGLKFG